MISLTRLNGKEFYINTDLIEFVESTPDTIITMTTGKKFVVKEEIVDIIEKITEYKKNIFQGTVYEKKTSKQKHQE